MPPDAVCVSYTTSRPPVHFVRARVQLTALICEGLTPREISTARCRVAHAKTLRERALEIYRGRYDLLSGAEIRALREQLGLTQQGLARLLRLGVNTLSRWEAGRVVQTASLDVLLRLLRDLLGSIDYLKRHPA